MGHGGDWSQSDQCQRWSSGQGQAWNTKGYPICISPNPRAWWRQGPLKHGNSWIDLKNQILIISLLWARHWRFRDGQALIPVPQGVKVPCGCPSISFLKDHQLYRLTGGIPESVIILAWPQLYFLKPFLKLHRCFLHTKFHSDSFQLEHPKPGPYG